MYAARGPFGSDPSASRAFLPLPSLCFLGPRLGMGHSNRSDSRSPSGPGGPPAPSASSSGPSVREILEMLEAANPDDDTALGQLNAATLGHLQQSVSGALIDLLAARSASRDVDMPPSPVATMTSPATASATIRSTVAIFLA